MKMDTGWYVLTPAGKAGPFASRADARAEADRFGWIVLAPATWPASVGPTTSEDDDA